MWSTAWCVDGGDCVIDVEEHSTADESTVLLRVVSEGGESLSMADDDDSHSLLVVVDVVEVTRDTVDADDG